MLTIKAILTKRTDDQDVLMKIFTADTVEEIHYTETGNTSLRFMRFCTSVGVEETNETTMLMDTNGVYGPSHVYVENMNGKTVQKFTAQTAVKVKSSKES